MVHIADLKWMKKYIPVNNKLMNENVSAKKIWQNLYEWQKRMTPPPTNIDSPFSHSMHNSIYTLDTMQNDDRNNGVSLW